MLKMGQILNAILILSLGQLLTSTHAKRPIFAHYYMSAVYSYDKSIFNSDFEWDVRNAIKAKLDGFILNIGDQDWEIERLSDMYDAASEYPGFKLFVNVNMTYPVNRNGRKLVDIVSSIYKKDSQFKINGKVVFGTYLGQDLYDQGSRVTWWNKNFFTPLKLQNIKIYFIPYWPLPPSPLFKDHAFVDAYQSFNAWPPRYDPIDYKGDEQYIETAHKLNKKVMSSVSPCYFTHFPNNNLVYRSEDTWHLRWEQLINSKADFAQVVSWNGFHESHAVGPINSNSSVGAYDWYNEMSNEAFARMLPFYAEWFRTGKQPSLTENVVFFYHRQHSKWAPETLNDPLPKPRTWEQANDAFVIHSFIKDSGTYDAQIYINEKPVPEKGRFVLKGGQISHHEVPFNDWYGPVTLAISVFDNELARSSPPTEIVGWGRIEKWNFNFNTRVVTF